MLTYSDEITVEEYNDLRRSVNWITVKDKRAQKALTNSFYKLIARKDGKPVGMARIVSDGGYTYFITDVIVRPECQGEHIGTQLIDKLLEYIKRDVMDDETVMVSQKRQPISRQSRFSGQSHMECRQNRRNPLGHREIRHL